MRITLPEINDENTPLPYTTAIHHFRINRYQALLSGISSGNTESRSDQNTGFIPGSTRSCTTLNTAGAASSVPTGKSVTPAAIWRKDTTPVGTAIVTAAIILPGRNGWKHGSIISCRYPTTIVSLPCPMSSTSCAAITDK